MRVSLKNIGNIKQADLKIDAITVIVGNNNTGKSTIGKSIYAFFRGTKDSEEENLNEQFISIQTELFNLENTFRYRTDGQELLLFKEISGELEEALVTSNRDKLRELFQGLKNRIPKDDKEQSISNIPIIHEIDSFLKLLEVDVTTPAYNRHFLETVFYNEFTGSINSVYAGAEEAIFTAEFTEKKRNEIVFKEDKMIQDRTHIEHFNHQGAIYLDNPFILDELSGRFAPRPLLRRSPLQHGSYLKKVLMDTWNETTVFNQFVHQDRFEGILSEVIEGEIKVKGNRMFFEGSNATDTIPIQNMATGMKSFSILKLLIESGVLAKQDVLILDEPEVHLHPSWQLRYAELIVLIAIEFNLKVLVTSHSPYFVEAIELYSKKYNIHKRTNYYQSSKAEIGNILKDMTDDLPKLYEDFAEPFIHLEELRDTYDDAD